MANYRKSFRVSYNVKGEDGFVIEKRQKFISLKDALIFIHFLNTGGNVIGKPTLENK